MGRAALILILFASTAPAVEVTVHLRWLEQPGKGVPPIRLDLEEYVAGVLAGEAAGFRSAEGLKAMAVVARTFAIRNRGRHRAEGFDLCDTTHCQDFRKAGITDRLRTVARDSAAELLWWRGTVAHTYYTKNCGGVREDASILWPDRSGPYLRQLTDPNCARDEWISEIRSGELIAALQQAGLRAPSRLASIAVVHRSPGHRATELSLNGAIALSASSLRFAIGRSLGWDRLPGDWYTVERGAASFRFRGQGHGHGAGLCQSGADRLGSSGKDAKQILAFYFPGTVLGVNAQGMRWQTVTGERVILKSTRLEDDRGILPVADRLWREVQQTFRPEAAIHPELRVYPTVARFRDATGSAGWNAAITRGTVIELQPTGILRAQGGWERILRHELAHVVMETAPARMPVWFREGLVLYATGPGLGPARLPASEADLQRNILHAQTAAQQLSAYAAARMLVERCVSRYGKEAVFGWIQRGLPAEVTYAAVSQAATSKP